MSFNRHDIEKNRAKAAEKVKILKSHLNSYTSGLDTSMEWVTEAYAEIDRLMTALANARNDNVELVRQVDDLREQLKVRDRDIQTLSTANEDLRRKAIIAESEPAKPQWKPPQSLANDQYRSHDRRLYQGQFSAHSWGFEAMRLLFADWEDAPDGLWKVLDGQAEYLGP